MSMNSRQTRRQLIRAALVAGATAGGGSGWRLAEAALAPEAFRKRRVWRGAGHRAAHDPETLQRIAFGSCARQDRPQPVWEAVLEDAPDLFVMLGDNIYGDSDDPAVLAAKYRQLGDIDGFRRLREQIRVEAIWDDHDYGANDAGREYSSKEASRRIMLDFFEDPPGSLRRERPDGIYTALEFGERGRRVQLILPDLRWNRTAPVRLQSPEALARREAEHRGPYEANLSEKAELLGESQWQWLEEQLRKEADLRIIGSSIQLLPEFTGWESWANFPRDRLRLFGLLEEYQREPVLILSGDTHWAELSEIRDPGTGWPLVELTSSGLTEEWEAISPNRHRLGDAFATANYGLVDIDWRDAGPVLRLRIRDSSGHTLIDHVADLKARREAMTSRNS